MQLRIKLSTSLTNPSQESPGHRHVVDAVTTDSDDLQVAAPPADQPRSVVFSDTQQATYSQAVQRAMPNANARIFRRTTIQGGNSAQSNRSHASSDTSGQTRLKIRGTGGYHNTTIRAAQKKVSLRLNYASLETTSEALREYIQEMTDIEDLVIEEIAPPSHITNKTYLCFKITTPCENRDKLLQEHIWPNEIVITSYRHPRPTTQTRDALGRIANL